MKRKQIFSGAVHYFRIHPDYWMDRLEKMKACGLNTIETYLAWNLHEKNEGEWDFSGPLDFLRFINMAGKLGLDVIVRPGPYICSEWDFGGFPAWLLNKEGMRIRCFNKAFLDAVDKYFAKVLPMLAPLQASNGGPIIMMQIENEYGSFGQDHDYVRHLKEQMTANSIDVELFTSDGASPLMLNGGTLPEVLKTVNFRNYPDENFKMLHQYQDKADDFVMELWSGAGSKAGQRRLVHSPEGVKKDLEEILAGGASVNFYMFHGGTNFGFMNGALALDDDYVPFTTSYDVDAPLTEAGDPTEKYYVIQELLTGKKTVQASSPKKAYGKFMINSSVPLMDALASLASPIQSVYPETMEKLGQSYGFILYRTVLEKCPGGELAIEGLRDRAIVFFNGVEAGILMRGQHKTKLFITQKTDGVQLDILVENMGRVNFGYEMTHEKKGLDAVKIQWQQQFNWQIYPLPLENIEQIKFALSYIHTSGSAFHKCDFDVDTPCDTFLRIPGGTRGVVWLNGFNLGRYWNVGPQKTLYVPAPILRQGKNSVIIFELHGLSSCSIEFFDKPDFGVALQMQL